MLVLCTSTANQQVLRLCAAAQVRRRAYGDDACGQRCHGLRPPFDLCQQRHTDTDSCVRQKLEAVTSGYVSDRLGLGNSPALLNSIDKL